MADGIVNVWCRSTPMECLRFQLLFGVPSINFKVNAAGSYAGPYFTVRCWRVVMRILYFLIISAFLVPSFVIADNYELSVTRKGSNLYKVDGKNFFIHTRYCYEYVYYESSFLKMNGYSGEIIFIDSGGKCDVKAVYGPIELQAGKYAVTVNREDDDWYEVWGQGVYIKTSGCLNLALGEEAVLSMSAGGYGTLYVGDDQCMVEGVYAKIRL